MVAQKNNYRRFIWLILGLIGALWLNLAFGSADIPPGILFDLITEKSGIPESWNYIIIEYRLPKAITSIITGAGLALCGLLMQTMFRNPLAGPFVLGISSGASLGAALLILGGGFLGGIWGNFQFNDSALILASSAGSILVLLIVIFMSSKLKDVMALLIVGLMFGSITSALVTVMASFSSAEQLQQFIFWSYGSTGNLSWNQVGLLLLIFGISLLVILRLMKVLNVLLLGENYAQSLGVALRTSRILIISVTGLLAGSITAFAGPIAFVGLAVPHLTRIWFGNSDHRLLVPGVCMVGGILMLVCDSIAQWPFSDYILPINAVTSAVGAPIVIALLIRKNKIRL